MDKLGSTAVQAISSSFNNEKYLGLLELSTIDSGCKVEICGRKQCQQVNKWLSYTFMWWMWWMFTQIFSYNMCFVSLSLSLSSTCYIMLYQVPVLEEIVYGRSAAHGIWLWWCGLTWWQIPNPAPHRRQIPSLASLEVGWVGAVGEVTGFFFGVGGYGLQEVERTWNSWNYTDTVTCYHSETLFDGEMSCAWMSQHSPRHWAQDAMPESLAEMWPGLSPGYMDCVSAAAVRFCYSGSGTRSKVQRWQQFAEPLFSQSEVVKIPRIVDETAAPELPRRAPEPRDDAPNGSGSPHVTPNEWRFSVDLREVLEAHRSIFSVKAEGEILFKARVCPGGVLAITDADSTDPDVLVRAGSGQKRMLTIMDGIGTYVGKLEISDARGLILYHMQKPCATITADAKCLSLHVYPLSADANFMRAASTAKMGTMLRIQVAKSFDPYLFLGCFLGIIILEPELMKRACPH